MAKWRITERESDDFTVEQEIIVDPFSGDILWDIKSVHSSLESAIKALEALNRVLVLDTIESDIIKVHVELDDEA